MNNDTETKQISTENNVDTQPTETTTPSIQNIHTLEGDLFAAMKDENYGSNVVKIVTNQDQNKNKRFFNTETETMKGDTSVVYKKYSIYSVLIICVFGISIFAYQTYMPGNKDNQPATTTVPTEQDFRPSTVINPEVFKKLSVTNLDKIGFINAVNTVKTELQGVGIKPNTNIEITLDVNTKSFFEKIKYSGPENFIRSLKPDYSFGYYINKERVFEPYILLEVSSYDLAFAGMLGWESFIFDDLNGLYTVPKAEKTQTTTQTTAQATTSSTTVSTNPKTPQVATQKSGNTYIFTDEVIKNTDVRVYKDTTKDIYIYYGFLNKKYLLITGGVDSFVDIKNKILNKNTLR